MNKENKKKAQERRAQERANEAGRKKVVTVLENWGPVILIVAVVIVMLVALITSGAGNEEAVDDSEFGFSFVDEDGNELEVSDWTEIDEDEDAQEDASDGEDGLDTTEGRVVESGDTVNIDFVGTVDGVEFAGGNTQGMGTDLTVGSGEYIDGFEDAIIGHSVGETFDLTVTFPDPYENDETLSGKQAVFSTTINGVYE